jgi:NAD(P)H dehydrogenase (quinone)
VIVVTGATGQLGRLVIANLLKTVPAAEVVAAVRTPSKAADLAAQGVQVRVADYNAPETLATAFAGADRVLLISSSEVGIRVAQHKAAIDAAKAAGVKLFAYTSLLRADTSTLGLAPEHVATETYLKASGLPYTLLRDGWYFENHTAGLGAALEHGAILGSAGDGRFAAATREDYAQAAVAVLTGEGHENKTYELAGDKSFTLSELATEVAKQSGKDVVYKNLPGDAYQGILKGFGLPDEVVTILVDSDAKAANGELDSDSKDLSNLTGHPTTSLSDAVRAALTNLQK